VPRYDRLLLDKNNDGNLDYHEWSYGPQKWMMQKIGVVYSKKNWAFDQFRLVAAYQNYQESRHDRKFGSTSTRRQFEQVHAVSVNADFDKEFGTKSTFLYGGEAVYNKVGSNAYRESLNGDQLTINPRYPDGSTWQSYGVYSNIKHAITETWIFNGGIRFSLSQIQADFDTTLFPYPVVSTTNNNNALNGSMGLVYHPNKNTQLYLNGSTGFRAPNIDDIGKVFDSEPGSVVVPNPDLVPEYAYNAEIGFVKAMKGKIKMVEAQNIIGEVIVYGRQDVAKGEIPMMIDRISKESIAFSNAQTAADILGNHGDVFIQKSQMSIN